MKKILVLIAVLIYMDGFGQREDHTWYFGETTIGFFFDFNTNAISITNIHPALNTSGCSVIADPVSGQVQYYTDGVTVRDRDHAIMPNGTGLNGHIYTVQSGNSCPFPGHPNQYLVFSNNGESPNPGSVYYSVVDMSLAGNGTVANPKGNVTSTKNVYVVNQTTEGLLLVADPVGNFWLILPQISTSNIRVFHVTASGIVLSNTYNLGYNVGVSSEIRYSTVSKKIGLANMTGNQPSLVMDFNPSTGVISNCYPIPGTPLSSNSAYYCGIFDMEWSPDGSKLYFSRYRDCENSSAGQLYQYDLSQPSNNAVLIATVAPSGYSNLAKGLKKGPDNKIYFMYTNSTTTGYYVGVINNPNSAGLACNYNPTQVNLGASLLGSHKFPEFLTPLECQGFVVEDTLVHLNYMCITNDTTTKTLHMGNLLHNPCNAALSVHVLDVASGSAHFGPDTTLIYTQPSTFVPFDTIYFEVCLQSSSICANAIAVIQFNYSGPPNPVITTEGDTLCSSAVSPNQWFFNGGALIGDTSQCIVAEVSGNYSVMTHLGNCNAESAPVFHWLVSADEAEAEPVSMIYPNPVATGQEITVVVGTDDAVRMKIMDVTGRMVMEQRVIPEKGRLLISTIDLIPGMYEILICSETKTRAGRFVISE